MNQVNNGNDITNAKKWKVLNEKDTGLQHEKRILSLKSSS